MTDVQDAAAELADQLGDLLNERKDDPRITARILSLFWREAVTQITCAGCRREHFKLASKMAREVRSYAPASNHTH